MYGGNDIVNDAKEYKKDFCDFGKREIWTLSHRITVMQQAAHSKQTFASHFIF